MRAFIAAYYGDPDLADRWAVIGDVDHCAGVLGRMVDAGLDHLMLNPVYDLEGQLELIARDLAPLI